MRAAPSPAPVPTRALLRSALRVALVKDRRDEPFDELFDRSSRSFASAPGRSGHGHGHAHDDLADAGDVGVVHDLRRARETPQQGHSHGKPADIRDFFRPEDLASGTTCTRRPTRSTWRR